MWKSLKYAIIGICIGVFSPAQAQGQCPAGQGECPSSLGGGCAPIGSVCCSGGTHCKAGFICGSGDECIPKSSPRVCANGSSYCESGYRCVKGNKCASLDTAPSRREGGSGDDSSGVRDARHCISIVDKGRGAYTVRNACTFAVTVRIQTMDFSPRTLSTDTYYIGANGSAAAYSYHRYSPNLLSACGKGSAC